MASGPDHRDEPGQGQVVTEKKSRVAKPPMYAVVLLNDDYTPMEFVVWILQAIFHRGENEAVQIMLHVHNNGIGVAGVYTHDIADAKVKRVTQLAEQNEFPLLTTMEPEE
jgi:ATP-dependent Clp protease adaptor protein ClpS